MQKDYKEGYSLNKLLEWAGKKKIYDYAINFLNGRTVMLSGKDSVVFAEDFENLKKKLIAESLLTEKDFEV